MKESQECPKFEWNLHPYWLSAVTLVAVVTSDIPNLSYTHNISMKLLNKY